MRFFMVVEIVSSGSGVWVAGVSSDGRCCLRVSQLSGVIRGPRLMRRASLKGPFSQAMVEDRLAAA
jgi:hypothetical protein